MDEVRAVVDNLKPLPGPGDLVCTQLFALAWPGLASLLSLKVLYFDVQRIASLVQPYRHLVASFTFAYVQDHAARFAISQERTLYEYNTRLPIALGWLTLLLTSPGDRSTWQAPVQRRAAGHQAEQEGPRERPRAGAPGRPDTHIGLQPDMCALASAMVGPRPANPRPLKKTPLLFIAAGLQPDMCALASAMVSPRPANPRPL
jgi:hypothetical protein